MATTAAANTFLQRLIGAMAAVLAVLGYSVNESVVIFDRIRENFRRYRKMNTVQIIDNAITSTISRTIITHGCTQAMVLSMLLFGGPTLHYFALALAIGICFGIYSSALVMAALVVLVALVGPAFAPHPPNALLTPLQCDSFSHFSAVPS